MARQRVDASLDAFDALIADLAEAGEIAPSEVTALRRQQRAPQTSEIPVQAEQPAMHSPWTRVAPVAAPAVESVPEPALEPAPAPSATPNAPAEVSAPARPLTRREARALREAAADPVANAADPVANAVEAENARRTEDLIHSHRVRPLPEERPAASVAAPKRKPRNFRKSLLATAGAVALIPTLWMVVPATANTTYGHPTADSYGHTAQQIMQVADDVQRPTIDQSDYVATAIAAIVTKVGGAPAEAAAPAIIDALSYGGERARIIETALGYIGTPYVLGGDSHTGIDCSGLTMQAYAAVGVKLAHYVPTQDAVGTRIPQSEAKAGDLVVFDNEDHVGLYLGDNQVLAAPAPGRRVSIESVDIWRPVGIHFTRILPAGQ